MAPNIENMPHTTQTIKANPIEPIEKIFSNIILYKTLYFFQKYNNLYLELHPLNF